MTESPNYLLTTCQVGADGALKNEIARVWPAFRFAYSRPGFVTFKLPAGATPPDSLDLESVFARAYAFSLGKATGATDDERAQSVWKLLADYPIERLHVWPRDTHEPGSRGYEPGMTPAALSVAASIQAACPQSIRSSPVESPGAWLPPPLNPPANWGKEDLPLAGEERSLPPRSREGSGWGDAAGAVTGTPDLGRLVADVVLVEPDEWWLGYHRIHSVASAWPGGLFPEPLPPDAASRVYLKMREALAWSGMPVARGDRVAEIGCAPGGASQALLDLGAQVIGIDPAEIDPLVAGHPRFRHIRRRSKEVPRKEFVGVDWLTCDINLPPNYTLDTVEAIASYPKVKLRGLVLTLKMIEWRFADQIPEYLARIRSWGFGNVRARQLHYNRREICVAATLR